jgi:hypothetical protein
MGTNSFNHNLLNQQDAFAGARLEVPMEMLKCKNENILPLKTFGCVCFVQDNRPNVGKLNPRVVKCIFVGYSGTQKGYVCWSMWKRDLFVSMNVIF